MDRAQLPFHRRAGRAELRHERQPRRPGPGQRGRERRVRGHRDRLLQGARHDRQRCRSAGPDPNLLLLRSARACSCPPDPLRRFVDKRADQADLRARTARTTRHGYDFVDPDENAARTAPPATTPGTRPRRRASASSRSTRSPRAASSSSPRTGTSTIPVQVARAASSTGRDGRRQGDRRLRPPPDPQPRSPMCPTRRARRAPADHTRRRQRPSTTTNPGCDIDPRASSRSTRRGPGRRPARDAARAARPVPARDRLRRRPHAREPGARVVPRGSGGGSVVGDRDRPRPPTGR